MKRFLSLVLRGLPIAIVFTLLGVSFAFAQEEEPVTAELAYYAIDNTILLITAVLVLFITSL